MTKKNRKGFLKILFGFKDLFGGGCNCGSFKLQEDDCEKTNTDQADNLLKLSSEQKNQTPDIITSNKSGPKSGGGCCCC